MNSTEMKFTNKAFSSIFMKKAENATELSERFWKFDEDLPFQVRTKYAEFYYSLSELLTHHRFPFHTG